MTRIACDVHTHTLFSRHAYSTVAENVACAQKQGLELLGITEHYSSMLFEEQTLRNFQYFINLKIWPREVDGLRLYHGCEADIVDPEGHLFGWDIPVGEHITGQPMHREHTLKEECFRECDYAIVSVHRKDFTQDRTPAQNAQMYIHALEDPKVIILGHIGRSGVDFELDPVLEAARDLHKLIEINEHSLDSHNRPKSIGPCTRVAERCAELGVSISFGSDAHICYSVGKSPYVSDLLEEIHFPEELVACRSAAAFEAFLPK